MPLELEDRLRETIDAYDRSPELYADRYLSVDFQGLRHRFLDALPTQHGPILDAGSGPGRDSAAFAQTQHPTVALDLSWQFVQRVAKTTNAGVVRGDLRAMPFAAESFEGVWMCSSLVHMTDDEILRCLQEARRVLRADGLLFCSMAFGDGDEWRFDRAGNRRWFHYLNRTDAIRLVREAGFGEVEAALDDGVVAGRWINLWARPKE